jgi:hypothetical protein
MDSSVPAEIFCERWTALIIRDLAAGAERFADLQRGVRWAMERSAVRPSSASRIPASRWTHT